MEHTVRVDGGFQVIVKGGKRFDLETRIRVPKDVLEQSLILVDPTEHGDDAEAA